MAKSLLGTLQFCQSEVAKYLNLTFLTKVNPKISSSEDRLIKARGADKTLWLQYKLRAF